MRNTCAKPITSWNSPATERLTRFLEGVFSNVLLKLPSWQPTNRNLPRHFFAPICNASKNVTKAFKGQSQHFLENSKKVWKEFGPLLFAVLILGTNTLVNITISVHKVVIRKKILQHYMIILWTTDIIWLKEKVNREKIMSKYTKTNDTYSWILWKLDFPDWTHTSCSSSSVYVGFLTNSANSTNCRQKSEQK